MRATWTAATLTAALSLTPVTSAAAVALPGIDTPQPVTAPAAPMWQPSAPLPVKPLPTGADPAARGKAPRPPTPLSTMPAAPADDGGGGGLLSIVTGLVKTLQDVLGGLLGVKLPPLPKLPAVPGALNDQATTTPHVPPATLAELQRTLDALHAAEAAARPTP
ncbi:hypothetical protein ACFVYD_36030 [Streptomyces sp. NPDC058301]|uniref:hypothetical protein n=1 Tax=Streptomyces sp. NPDC058301 TaxID=3346436 RepID=UPI0036E6B939